MELSIAHMRYMANSSSTSTSTCLYQLGPIAPAQLGDFVAFHQDPEMSRSELGRRYSPLTFRTAIALPGDLTLLLLPAASAVAAYTVR